MGELIFVYGTLRPGSDHEMAGYLASLATHVGGGFLQGSLFRVSWYPAYVQTGNDSIRGDLFLVQDEQLLGELDRYEGCSGRVSDEYRRQRLLVGREGGGEVEAWVYVFQGETSGLEKIMSGNFLQP